ncbi:MAG: BatA domain-containing protein [Bacteroidota bacterium]|nr:BatA domain-containing protein [Bacteroidota bacterium]
MRPNLLWGFSLIIIPIWIHFFGLRPRQTKSIPSLIWLKSINPSKRRRRKMKDWLVLLLRITAIALVVISLANPTPKNKIFKIQIDNSSAGWTQKEQWLKPMLANLPAGLYKLYDRSGIFFGEYSREACWPICENLAPSNGVFNKIEEANTLSFGYNSLDSSLITLIPERLKTYNVPISQTVNELGSRIISVAEPCNFKFYNETALIDLSLTSSYEIGEDELKWGDSLTLLIEVDSILEDNVFIWKKRNKSKRIVIHQNNPKIFNEFLQSSDSIVAYDSGGEYDLSMFSAVVLIGLDFMPSFLSGYSGKILSFKDATRFKENNWVYAIPDLSHLFFQSYFIGPSIQNAWPEIKEYDTLAGREGILLRSEKGVIAALADKVYEQRFMPKDWGHPYYRALGKWSNNQEIEFLHSEFLGTDYYDDNKELKSVSLFKQDLSIQSLYFSDSFFTEKLYLILALLCVLFALIFIKT